MMTRLHYWLHAKTQYNIHSPFVFEMYREVLFARLDDETRRQHGIPRDDRFREIVYKCCCRYHLVAGRQWSAGSGQQAVQLSARGIVSPDAGSQLSIIILDRPHATPAAEQQWEHLKTNPDYQVSIDLYDVALLIHNSHLHPQHFLLR